MQHTYWSSSSFLPNIIKICLRVSKLWPAQDFRFRGDNYTTNKKITLSYTQRAYWSSSSSLPNIIKLSQTVGELWPAFDFGFRRGNYIRKTVRVVSLARDTPIGHSCKQHTYWSSSSFLPNITKICLKVSKLWSAQG